MIILLHACSHKGFLPKFVKRLKDMKFLREDLVFSVHSVEVITYCQCTTCPFHVSLLSIFSAPLHFEFLCFLELELLNFQFPFSSFSLLLKFRCQFRCTRTVCFVLLHGGINNINSTSMGDILFFF